MTQIPCVPRRQTLLGFVALASGPYLALGWPRQCEAEMGHCPSRGRNQNRSTITPTARPAPPPRIAKGANAGQRRGPVQAGIDAALGGSKLCGPGIMSHGSPKC